MVKSGFFNLLAYIIIIAGAFVGLFVGASADSFVAVLSVWGPTFFLAVILFYLGASLYHLEHIHGNTSALLQDTKKQMSNNTNQGKIQATSQATAIENSAPTQQGSRCLLCGKKYVTNSGDPSNTCPECQKLID